MKPTFSASSVASPPPLAAALLPAGLVGLLPGQPDGGPGGHALLHRGAYNRAYLQPVMVLYTVYNSEILLEVGHSLALWQLSLPCTYSTCTVHYTSMYSISSIVENINIAPLCGPRPLIQL